MVVVIIFIMCKLLFQLLSYNRLELRHWLKLTIKLGFVLGLVVRVCDRLNQNSIKVRIKMHTELIKDWVN